MAHSTTDKNQFALRGTIEAIWKETVGYYLETVRDKSFLQELENNFVTQIEERPMKFDKYIVYRRRFSLY